MTIANSLPQTPRGRVIGEVSMFYYIDIISELVCVAN